MLSSGLAAGWLGWLGWLRKWSNSTTTETLFRNCLIGSGAGCGHSLECIVPSRRHKRDVTDVLWIQRLTLQRHLCTIDVLRCCTNPLARCPAVIGYCKVAHTRNPCCTSCKKKRQRAYGSRSMRQIRQQNELRPLQINNVHKNKEVR